jgi:hypothetical protein
MSASSEVIRFAGDVSIDQIEILSSDGFYQDIKNQVIGIRIFEDLFSPFITGIITVKDSIDYVNLFPLVGSESIRIALHTPSFTQTSAVIDTQFQIFKVSNRELLGDRNLVYQIHFISKEALVDLNKKISKAFSGKISDVAKILITDPIDGLESKKNVVIEETTNGIKYLSNYWSAVKNLNYICDSAVNVNGNAGFLFFQNRNGYNFVSTEALYAQDSIQTFTYDAYMRDFLPDGTSKRNIKEEYKRIIEISAPTVFDYLDRIRMGMYASKMISHDITTKKYTEKNYSMFSNYYDELHLNEYPLTPLNTTMRADAMIINNPKYYANFNNFGDVTNSKSLQRRISTLQQVKGTKLEITVPGRTDYTVGSVVTLILHKFTPIKSGESDTETIDKILSGNYIISSINHIIDREKHECKIEVIKDTYITDLDKGGQ